MSDAAKPKKNILDAGVALEGHTNPAGVDCTKAVESQAAGTTIDYIPLKEDMIPDPSGVKFKDYLRITANYAKDPLGRGYFVHGNSRIKVLINGRDVTNDYTIIRYLRDWLISIDKNGNKTGEFIGPGNFIDDGINIHSWVDIPGELLVSSPDSWPLEKYVQEYLVSVYQHPEFGFLYFTIIIDTKPNFYNVHMYNAMKITEKQFNELRDSKAKAPYREISGYEAIKTGWQRAEK